MLALSQSWMVMLEWIILFRINKGLLNFRPFKQNAKANDDGLDVKSVFFSMKKTGELYFYPRTCDAVLRHRKLSPTCWTGLQTRSSFFLLLWQKFTRPPPLSFSTRLVSHMIGTFPGAIFRNELSMTTMTLLPLCKKSLVCIRLPCTKVVNMHLVRWAKNEALSAHISFDYAMPLTSESLEVYALLHIRLFRADNVLFCCEWFFQWFLRLSIVYRESYDSVFGTESPASKHIYWQEKTS